MKITPTVACLILMTVVILTALWLKGDVRASFNLLGSGFTIDAKR